MGWVNFIGLRFLNSFGWQTPRDIQDNKIIKSMYLWLFIVPITAKLLASVEGIINVNIFGQPFIFDLVLPFSWQALFFSALSFVLANIIFILFSPEIVKEYKNYQNFIDAGKGDEQLKEYISLLKEERQKEIKKLKELAGIVRVKTGDNLQNRFWDVYDLACYERIKIRFIGSFFYVIGFLLFADVVYKNINWVIGPMNFKEFNDQLFFGGIIDFILNIL